MNNVKNMKILIVDDYGTMIKILRTILKGLGFINIDEARDGSQAIQMCKMINYDLIFSDWNMEPLTGLQFLQWIRNNDTPNKNIPFIMVTAESKTDNIITARAAGVSNYIVKPFTADTLKTKINQVFTDLL
jgi:two-component system chemotaxis response regulator CheY